MCEKYVGTCRVEKLKCGVEKLLIKWADRRRGLGAEHEIRHLGAGTVLEQKKS